MKRIISITAALFVGLTISLSLFVSSANAVTFDQGEHVRIDFQGQDETRVLTGNTVELTGEIDGDVYVFAESLISKAVINGDLIGAVGTGLISGTITGNVRMLGSDLAFSGKGNNVTVAAGTVSFNKESNFQDVFVASQQAGFSGTTRSTHFAGNKADIGGRTNEQLSINSHAVNLDPNASVGGNLIIKSKQQPEQFNAIQVGGTREFKPRSKPAISFKPIDMLVRLFWLLVLVYTLRSSTTVRTSFHSFTPNAKSVLLSVLALILIPIAIILLIITLIGLPLALITALLAIIGFVIAKPLFVMLVSELVSKNKSMNIHAAILLASLATIILTHLPFIAPLFQILIFLCGWSLTVHMFRELIRSKTVA